MTGLVAACGAAGTASSASINITNQSIYDAGRGSQTATYTIANDGTVKNQVPTILESWLNGTGGSVGNYEVRATVTYGTLSSGTTDSWLSCATSRDWSVTNSAGDNSTVTVVLTIEIRLASTGVVQDSATITLNAESIEAVGGGGGRDGLGTP